MKITRGAATSATRRALLALAPLLAQPRIEPAAAATSNAPKVQVISTPDLCQGRCRDQDFVALRYTGRLSDGTIFDDRYAERPLIFELGSFYLPGVDASLQGACVGSKYRLTWASGADLGPEFAGVIPASARVEVDAELTSIKYSLFGEKMRNASSTYWFTDFPLTLTSAADYQRGHASSRPSLVTKDNPFSIAPGENSIISNPSSVLGPLFNVGPLLKGLFSSQ